MWQHWTWWAKEDKGFKLRKNEREKARERESEREKESARERERLIALIGHELFSLFSFPLAWYIQMLVHIDIGLRHCWLGTWHFEVWRRMRKRRTESQRERQRNLSIKVHLNSKGIQTLIHLTSGKQTNKRWCQFLNRSNIELKYTWTWIFVFLSSLPMCVLAVYSVISVLSTPVSPVHSAR